MDNITYVILIHLLSSSISFFNIIFSRWGAVGAFKWTFWYFPKWFFQIYLFISRKLEALKWTEVKPRLIIYERNSISSNNLWRFYIGHYFMAQSFEHFNPNYIKHLTSIIESNYQNVFHLVHRIWNISLNDEPNSSI